MAGHSGMEAEVVSKEAAFEFAAKIIDATVPSLSPEIYQIFSQEARLA